MKNKILVVDDEPQIRESISDILNDAGYETILAGDGLEAENKLLTEDVDAVILDVMMPKKGGLDLLDHIQKEYPLISTIIISGHGNIKMAVDAMRRGAYDFVEKPLSMDRILSSIRNAVRIKELQLENIDLKSRLEKPLKFIGKSASMQQILNQIPNIAQSDASVLITGENGTGKEMIARLIHHHSKQTGKSFIGVNCAAIPDTLIESELFGYEKGAFTGANKQKKGKFEMAHKGTIFLDEIGDLSLPAQAKVLRVLQEKELERVGGNEIIKVDVRVLAATNKDIAEAIKAGNFRQDLFYRLNVVPIHIPALRDRKEDISLLVNHFLDEFNEKNAKNVGFTKGAMNVLSSRAWPGNVRELRNFVERLVILAGKESVDTEDVKRFIFPDQSPIDTAYDTQGLKEAKHTFEKQLIINRLMKFGMNITRTAESLEIERTYLHKKIKELEIDKDLELND